MRKTIVSIVGARPQFIKAAPVSRAIRRNMREILVHTGQHYDDCLSGTFFDELEIPRPDHYLEVGSNSHGAQTGLMMERIEKVIFSEKPDLVLVYGDTNSTLAGAVDAAKLHIPLGHVEAGLRSFNRRMPEEINRILTDSCSDFLFCPTLTSVRNLKNEGIVSGVHLTGDVMYDAALMFAETAAGRSGILERLGVKPKEYLLCTVHRAENTDSEANLKSIVNALVACGKKIVFPVHPRTQKFLSLYGLDDLFIRHPSILGIGPVGYLDMILLERNASAILTDSGGVQKESYFYRVPCITLRGETEWVETVEDGWNRLAGTETESILDAVRNFRPASEPSTAFGDGHAAEKIAEIIYENIVI
jgi:UDP-N-acetylglucosamine 2-epimerase